MLSISREEIIEALWKDGHLNHWCCQERWYARTERRLLLASILSETSFLPTDFTLRDRLWYLRLGLTEPVGCKVCGKAVGVESGSPVLRTLCGDAQCTSVFRSRMAKERPQSEKAKRQRGEAIRRFYLAHPEKKGQSTRTRRGRGTPYRKGFSLSSATRSRISESNKGKHRHSESWRRRQSLISKALHRDPQYKAKMNTEKARKKQSETMKQNILSGSFTPEITNTWTHWTALIEVDGVVRKFRSTWDACFWLLNRDEQYEAVRIPYLFAGEIHTYLTDFYNPNTGIITEVKPASQSETGKFKAKVAALHLHCKALGRRYQIIGEEYFRTALSMPETASNRDVGKAIVAFVSKFAPPAVSLQLDPHQREVKEIGEWEVLTPSGWREFKGVQRTTHQVVYDVVSAGKVILSCSKHHKHLLGDGRKVETTQLDKGTMLAGGTEIEDVVRREQENESFLYDLLGVADGALYQTNSTVSGNSAFISQMSDLWTACAPTISTGGKAIALSTPNGAQGWFYQTCMLAEEAQRLKQSGILLTKEQEGTNFHMVTLPWHVHPERDQAWYDNMCKTFNFDLRKISQELDCSFAYSGQKVIMPEFLKRAKEDPRRVPIIAGHTDRMDEILDRHLPHILNMYDVGDENDQESYRLSLRRCMESMLTIYKVPLPKDEIVIAADVASGGGSDYSAFVGMDQKGYQVCGFKGKVDTKVFSIILYIVGMFYNEAGLAIERNSYGNDVILRLESDLGYGRVLEGLDGKTGFLTTGGGTNASGGSRNFFVSRLIGFIQNPVFKDAPVINDGRLLHEMEVFVWAEHNTGYGRKQKAEATAGENDDLVMSLAILATVLTTWDQSNKVFGILSPEALGAVAENMLMQQDPTVPQEDKRMQDGDIFSVLEDVYTGVNYDDNPAVLAQESVWNAFGIEHADRKTLKRQDHGMVVRFEK